MDSGDALDARNLVPSRSMESTISAFSIGSTSVQLLLCGAQKRLGALVALIPLVTLAVFTLLLHSVRQLWQVMESPLEFHAETA